MDEEAEITRILTGIVDAWIAQGSSGAVVPATLGVMPDVLAMLLATGYLVADSDGGAGAIPTSEALNLTDPFLCEELASAFQWEFHRRFLVFRHGAT